MWRSGKGVKVDFIRDDDGKVGLAIWDLSNAEWIALNDLMGKDGLVMAIPTIGTHRFEIWPSGHPSVERGRVNRDSAPVDS
jgi:hypothetical protein